MTTGGNRWKLVETADVQSRFLPHNPPIHQSINPPGKFRPALFPVAGEPKLGLPS
jgi:hypothetical protein